MVATFNANPKSKIISCYSPTNVSDETDLIAFYKEISSLVRSIPKLNILIKHESKSPLMLAKEKKKKSRRYPAQTITDVDYAGDIALLANTPAPSRNPAT